MGWILSRNVLKSARFKVASIVVLSGRPTHVVREIAVPLPRPRDQITTRESPDFLDIRHEVLGLIRRERQPEGGGGRAP